MIPKVLSIAGSDPSGGAGIQADLKTFAAFDVYGMAVLSALTAQNTKGVQGVYPVPAEFLEMQLHSIFADVPPAALKIGMVGDVHSITTLAALLNRYDARHIVLDPVMVSSSGDTLISDEAIDALKTYLIPLADVITPNIHEAEILGSDNVEDLLKLGAKAVLLKGGHADGDTVVDVLASAGGIEHFEAPRIDTKNTHGTGCTLSAAIAAGLAKGLDLPGAVAEAKSYITGALQHADALDVGSGSGPVHHFWKKGS